MTRIPGAPMPDSIRHGLRAQQHPARSVACPHCGAKEHRPCTSRSKTRQMPQPHPSRISAWVRATAVCPECQVEPGVPCHLDGRELRDGAVHPRREVEAREVAA
ncbi:zinc finger domain-containing protein [Streptomyces malaysiensis]|uniref:zinc finger domain-containing protein n=1 Tax=Streptomyces malaysiensis TaxID=92644 RepID=UPI00369E1A28